MNDVQLKKWLWIVFVFILSLFFLFYGISRIKKHKKEKPKTEVKNDNKTESKKVAWVWMVTRTQTISINNEYSSIYYLSKGEGLSLKNSTQPYCVKNENSHCKCGEKGEDVTPKLPREDKNMELRFRTSNGEYGEITLVYWEKIIASNK